MARVPLSTAASFLLILLPVVHSLSSECLGSSSPCLSFSQEIYDISMRETDSTNMQATSSPDPILITKCNVSNGPLNVTYSLIKRSGSPFGINPMTGEITVLVQEELDYEVSTGFTFMVVCADANDPSINDTASVIINLLPVNEHRPGHFTTFYGINCSTEVGELDGLVHGVAYSVIDRDIPKGDLYFTTDNYQDMFSINVSTGQVSLLRRITNTTNQLFPLRITVCDFFPVIMSCQNSLILITFSSKDPSFSQQNYSINIHENVPVNTILSTVECRDEGCANYSRAVEVINGTDLNGMVSMDERGKVRSTQEFDFEKTKMLQFEVRCYNKITSHTFSRSLVTLNILDENDNPPVCPSPTLTTILKAGTYESGHVILQIACTDEDSDANGQLTYTVQGELPNLEEGEFSLDRTTGTLTFSGKIGATAEESYDIYVLVADSGETPLTETVKVTVNLAQEGSLSAPTRYTPMLVVIVASIAGGLLLLCCVILLCLLMLYCILQRRKSNKRKIYLTSKKESLLRLPTVPNIYEENTGIQELNLHFWNEQVRASSDAENNTLDSGSTTNSDSSIPSSSQAMVVSNTAIFIDQPQDVVTVSTFVQVPEKYDELNDQLAPPDHSEATNH